MNIVDIIGSDVIHTQYSMSPDAHHECKNVMLPLEVYRKNRNDAQHLPTFESLPTLNCVKKLFCRHTLHFVLCFVHEMHFT